ncbi:MAG: Permease of the drug/metabolite transporter (DMT) superfamily, partial [uncultured Rubrobacteraceae bacterium]
GGGGEGGRRGLRHGGRAGLRGGLLGPQLRGDQVRGRLHTPARARGRPVRGGGWAAVLRAASGGAEEPARKKGPAANGGARVLRGGDRPDRLHFRRQPRQRGEHRPDLRHSPRVGPPARLGARPGTAHRQGCPRRGPLRGRRRLRRLRGAGGRGRRPSRRGPGPYGRRLRRGVRGALDAAPRALLAAGGRDLPGALRGARSLAALLAAAHRRGVAGGRGGAAAGGRVRGRVRYGLRLRGMAERHQPHRGEPGARLPVPHHPGGRHLWHRLFRRDAGLEQDNWGRSYPARRLPGPPV